MKCPTSRRPVRDLPQHERRPRSSEQRGGNQNRHLLADGARPIAAGIAGIVPIAGERGDSGNLDGSAFECHGGDARNITLPVSNSATAPDSQPPPTADRADRCRKEIRGIDGEGRRIVRHVGIGLVALTVIVSVTEVAFNGV